VNYQKRFLLEKLSLQAMAIAAMAIVYFLIAGLWRPSDPQAGMSLVLSSNLNGTVGLLLTIWGLAAVIGAITVFMRPHGAMLIVLFGASGFALRSASIRAWLWQYGADLTPMYGGLILELVAGSIVLFVSAVIVDATRRFVAEVRPDWLWQSPLEDLTAEQLAAITHGQAQDVTESTRVSRYLRPAGSLVALFKGVVSERRSGATSLGYAGRSIAAVAMTLAIGMAAVMLLMQSPDRGQVLFALLAGFFLAALIVHVIFSPRHSMVIMAAPVLAGVLSYVLGAVTSVDRSPVGWAHVKLYARALPVDWLFAGSAGVLLACWVAHRHHEWKTMERIYEDVTS